jgi:hypothetical protein
VNQGAHLWSLEANYAHCFLEELAILNRLQISVHKPSIGRARSGNASLALPHVRLKKLFLSPQCGRRVPQENSFDKRTGLRYARASATELVLSRTRRRIIAKGRFDE